VQGAEEILKILEEGHVGGDRGRRGAYLASKQKKTKGSGEGGAGGGPELSLGRGGSTLTRRWGTHTVEMETHMGDGKILFSMKMQLYTWDFKG
jgi:hypothetical protein